MYLERTDASLATQVRVSEPSSKLHRNVLLQYNLRLPSALGCMDGNLLRHVLRGASKLHAAGLLSSVPGIDRVDTEAHGVSSRLFDWSTQIVISVEKISHSSLYCNLLPPTCVPCVPACLHVCVQLWRTIFTKQNGTCCDCDIAMHVICDTHCVMTMISIVEAEND